MRSAAASGGRTRCAAGLRRRQRGKKTRTSGGPSSSANGAIGIPAPTRSSSSTHGARSIVAAISSTRLKARTTLRPRRSRLLHLAPSVPRGELSSATPRQSSNTSSASPCSVSTHAVAREARTCKKQESARAEKLIEQYGIDERPAAPAGKGRRPVKCSTSTRSSESPTPNGLDESELSTWRERGQEYAVHTAALMSPSMALSEILDSPQSNSGVVGLDEALDAFVDPERARRRAAIRSSFVAGAVEALGRMGALQLGAPSEADIADGLAPARTADADHRRC